ncbi:hypothetical protein [Streptomyces sp. NBC_00645]|uniref:hypothetical protein n=1 Tax=Streptomyces sp. NBC_00645 TaxID=2975795 RepID=UPI0032439630
MTGEVECQLCHKPVRSGVARTRRVGSRCWRKLRPDQRATITALTRRGRSLGPHQIRAALNRPAPAAPDQLALTGGDSHEQQN